MTFIPINNIFYPICHSNSECWYLHKLLAIIITPELSMNISLDKIF